MADNHLEPSILDLYFEGHESPEDKELVVVNFYETCWFNDEYMERLREALCIDIETGLGSDYNNKPRERKSQILRTFPWSKMGKYMAKQLQEGKWGLLPSDWRVIRTILGDMKENLQYPNKKKPLYNVRRPFITVTVAL
ncbi:hypothetical protein CVT24_004215 [Panaeolus cyanescens]|uniref:Uncharacterized protein n=1 Tax=Panaeolus cyanescens TaxID=181874 RepID=A0A409YSV8_9AGAR|nr:hypothetical protein CVT24_004215 [Panaeolus cyanescens]